MLLSVKVWLGPKNTVACSQDSGAGEQRQPKVESCPARFPPAPLNHYEVDGNKKTRATFVAGLQGRGVAWVTVDTGSSVEQGSTPAPPYLTLSIPAGRFQTAKQSARLFSLGLVTP